MNFLYNKIKELNFGTGFKIFLFLGIFTSFCAVCGFIAGMIFTLIQGHSFEQNAITLICFAGYPAFFIGLTGGCIYLMRK